MSRRVTHDGRSGLEIRFSFDRSLVDLVKSLPHRRWNATDRCWRVPDSDVVALVDLLLPHGFQFDDMTSEQYRDRGGRSELSSAPAADAGNAQPGLFDDGEAPGDDAIVSVTPKPVSAAATAEHLSVAQLNQRVKAVLERAFPDRFWLVGEISGFDKNAHRKHVSFHLVEHDENGSSLAEVNATLFARTRAEIEVALATAGDPFRLQDEVEVRLHVRVELYVPWGSYRVIVEGVDVRYTLGEAARRREEILRKLTAEGLRELNATLPLPAFPLRVGLVTSLGSDAYNDVLRTLQESGYAFDVTVHGARVQGRSTEPSVLNALDWFRARADDFDAVLICRGGGSRTDLAWFDAEAIGRACARFPLPIIAGIGHEQDHGVVDAVTRRAKTPTAAAARLVDTVSDAARRLDVALESILARSRERLTAEGQSNDIRARRLVASSRLALERGHRALDERQRRTSDAGRERIRAAESALIRHTNLLPARVQSRCWSGSAIAWRRRFSSSRARPAADCRRPASTSHSVPRVSGRSRPACSSARPSDSTRASDEPGRSTRGASWSVDMRCCATPKDAS